MKHLWQSGVYRVVSAVRLPFAVTFCGRSVRLPFTVAPTLQSCTPYILPYASVVWIKFYTCNFTIWKRVGQCLRCRTHECQITVSNSEPSSALCSWTPLTHKNPSSSYVASVPSAVNKISVIAGKLTLWTDRRPVQKTEFVISDTYTIQKWG